MRIIIWIVLGLSFLSGCVSPMRITSEPTPPSPTEVQVIFMRAAFTGCAIKTALYEITETETKFIAILPNKTKFAYTTTPGKHTFMVTSEAADFMDADLIAGKTYYSIVEPRMGVFRYRFSLWPARTGSASKYNMDGEAFERIYNVAKPIENTPESIIWSQQKKEIIMKKQKEYMKKWDKKSIFAIKRKTLRPSDGI